MTKFLLSSIIIIVSFLSLTSFNFGDRYNENTITVSPNPIRDRATVACNYYIQKIEVYNLIGVIITEGASNAQIDLTDQSRGYYIIKVYTPNGEFVKRVFKE
jgi:Secretion system C-terminal sorting domain